MYISPGLMGTVQKSWELWMKRAELILLFIPANTFPPPAHSLLPLCRSSTAVPWEPATLATHRGNSPVLEHFLILRATQAA